MAVALVRRTQCRSSNITGFGSTNIEMVEWLQLSGSSMNETNKRGESRTNMSTKSYKYLTGNTSTKITARLEPETYS